jgi:hypothetical protein
MYLFNKAAVGQKQPFTVNSTFVTYMSNTGSSYAYRLVYEFYRVTDSSVTHANILHI